MEKRLKLDYPILFDAGNRVAAEWRLTFDFADDLKEVYQGFGIDVPGHNGEGDWTLPMPARYVIDTGGIIREAAVHPDYTQRPEPAATLEAVRAL